MLKFFLDDEQYRVFLTSMVACLFARSVYTKELLGQCLHAVGYQALADTIDQVSAHIQKLRWKTRIATGFDPKDVSIPKRFMQVITWKGPIDEAFLMNLKDAYARKIIELAILKKIAWKENLFLQQSSLLLFIFHLSYNNNSDVKNILFRHRWQRHVSYSKFYGRHGAYCCRL